METKHMCVYLSALTYHTYTFILYREQIKKFPLTRQHFLIRCVANWYHLSFCNLLLFPHACLLVCYPLA